MKLCLLFCILFYLQSYSQEIKTLRITSSHTSFPDSQRANGHTYNKKLYDATSHYNDSNVAIYIPPSYRKGSKVNLVFWFHGWQNNIDSAAKNFELPAQLMRSGINAILVFPETAKNSPDSYGGKLEKQGMFKYLVSDILAALKKNKIINHQLPGDITLAGHSGAYRVIAFILQNGGIPVKNVLLFDALYGETTKYITWLKDTTHRFINIYTNSGGTNLESRKMALQLQKENINSVSIEEADVDPGILQNNRIVIIHSRHKHNDVIKRPDNFALFLASLK